MGDETIEFASRFATAVASLAELAAGDAEGQLRGLRGEALAAAVGRALDAVQSVYETATKDVRDWPERRKRVLAAVASVRDALARSGVDDAVRRLAGALVRAMDDVGGSAVR